MLSEYNLDAVDCILCYTVGESLEHLFEFFGGFYVGCKNIIISNITT